MLPTHTPPLLSFEQTTNESKAFQYLAYVAYVTQTGNHGNILHTCMTIVCEIDKTDTFLLHVKDKTVLGFCKHITNSSINISLGELLTSQGRYLCQRTWIWDSVLAPHSRFFLKQILKSTGDGSIKWVPESHEGGLDIVPGSLLQLSRVLAITSIWRKWTSRWKHCHSFKEIIEKKKTLLIFKY